MTWWQIFWWGFGCGFVTMILLGLVMAYLSLIFTQNYNPPLPEWREP